MLDYRGNKCDPLPVTSLFVVIGLSVLYAYFVQSDHANFDLTLDGKNYLNYANNSKLIWQRYISNGTIKLVFNEPIWLGINIVLGSFFEPSTTVRIIQVLFAFIFSFTLLKQSASLHTEKCLFVLSILIIFSPFLVKNYITHLRQGSAIAVFVLGYYSQNKRLRYALILVSPFIHSSFFMIVPLVFICGTIGSQKNISYVFVFCLAYAIFVSLAILVVAKIVGARQSELYSNALLDISGVGFFVWLCILFLFLSSGYSFVKNNQFSIAVILLYLVSYPCMAVSARIFESGVSIVIVSGLYLRKTQRVIYILFLLTLFGVGWYNQLVVGKGF